MKKTGLIGLIFFVLLPLIVMATAGCAKTGLTNKTTKTETWDENIILNKTDLASTGVNPYFNLTPGYQLIYEGSEKGKAAGNTITVLKETKVIDGVETRIVEERGSAEGKLAEVSRNYFAISKKTGTVYYFGEDVDEYNASGQITGHSGTWHAGENGAKAGVMMQGKVETGMRYYQEIAPKVAKDRAKIISVTETLSVPQGKYSGVIKIEETTPLEPAYKDYKFYAKDIGSIKDGELLLVRTGFVQ